MISTRIFLFPVLIILLCMAACGTGEKKSETPVRTEVDSTTAAFFKRTAKACLQAIDATELAMKKSGSKEFGDLCAKINAQQKELIRDLKQLADIKAVNLPDSSATSGKNRLGNATRDEFERKVLLHLSSSLRSELKAMKSVNESTDAGIKSLISRYMPDLKASVDTLRSLRVRKFPATKAVKHNRAVRKA